MAPRVRRWWDEGTFLLACLAHALTASLTGLVGRDESCWVFGARFGDAFADNARYLFEYADEREEVRAVWLSGDPDVVAEVRERGYEAYHRRSLRGCWLTLRAGCVLFTHGLRDVSLPLTGGAVVVNCWHGLPLKTIGFDAELGTKSWLVRRGHRYVASRTDLLLCPSPMAVHEMATGLGVTPDRIEVLPYPRYDALVAPASDETTREHESGPSAFATDRTLVFYIPTFREVGADLADRVDFDTLVDLLAAHDAHLVVKPHPYERVTFSGDPDRVTTVDAATDLSALLSAADVLVTDYSSVFLDYLLLDRPMVFYAPDLDDYRADRGFYYDYETLVPGPVARDDEALRSALDDALTDDPAATQRRALRDAFLVETGERPSAAVYESVRFALDDAR